jgi:hypothetical protein
VIKHARVIKLSAHHHPHRVTTSGPTMEDAENPG